MGLPKIVFFMVVFRFPYCRIYFDCTLLNIKLSSVSTFVLNYCPYVHLLGVHICIYLVSSDVLIWCPYMYIFGVHIYVLNNVLQV